MTNWEKMVIKIFETSSYFIMKRQLPYRNIKYRESTVMFFLLFSIQYKYLVDDQKLNVHKLFKNPF